MCISGGGKWQRLRANCDGKKPDEILPGCHTSLNNQHTEYRYMYSETRPNLYTHPLHLFSTQEPYTCSITYLLHTGYTYIHVHCVPTTHIFCTSDNQSRNSGEKTLVVDQRYDLCFIMSAIMFLLKVKLLRAVPPIGLITVNRRSTATCITGLIESNGKPHQSTVTQNKMSNEQKNKIRRDGYQ